MKKTLIALSVVLAFAAGGTLFQGCGGSESHDHSEHAHETSYQCPMKCEGEKTYAEAGTCPVCKMDLEAVASEDDHGHNH